MKICVIGAVNMDIGGTPYTTGQTKDSNPGRIVTTLGGVGRNIAHNLCLLGAEVSFVSAFGADAFGEQMKKSCVSLGMHVDHCACFQQSSTYLFITDEKGEMVNAISDMSIYDACTPALISSHIPYINQHDLVVLDTNFPTETLRMLCEQVTCPIFVDPVSTIKAKKLQGLLPYIHTLKPNLLELGELSAVAIMDEGTIQEACEVLLAQGVTQVHVSLDSEGSYATNARERHRLPSMATNYVNSTGCGDASTAAIAWAYAQGLSLRQQALFAQGAAAICIESPHTVSDAISASAVWDRVGAC